MLVQLTVFCGNYYCIHKVYELKISLFYENMFMAMFDYMTGTERCG